MALGAFRGRRRGAEVVHRCQQLRHLYEGLGQHSGHLVWILGQQLRHLVGALGQ